MHDGARFDPLARHGHVESYFIKINDPEATRALWIKATILAKPDDASPVAEGWAIAFERGKDPTFAKVTMPYDSARFSRTELDLTVGDFDLTPRRARGTIGAITFDLALDDPSPPLVHFPRARMYEGRFPNSKLVSPMPDLTAHGEVKLGDRTWNVDGWRGLLGHNWGRGHAFAYAWGHCNVWNDPKADLVFEGASARVRVGPILTPMTTLLLVRHHGVLHALNRVRTIVLHNRAWMTLRRWRFSGRGPTLSVRGELWSDDESMVGLAYENPEGPMTYCLNSKLSSARLEISSRDDVTRVFTSRAAALEIGTRDPNHGVRMVL